MVRLQTAGCPSPAVLPDRRTALHLPGRSGRLRRPIPGRGFGRKESQGQPEGHRTLKQPLEQGPPKETGLPAGGPSDPKAKERTNRLDPTAKRRLVQALLSGGMTGRIFMMAAPPPPPPPPRTILIGPPVSRSRQRRLGIARFVPGLGYEKRLCSRCRKHLWVGPKQLGLLADAPNTPALCTACLSEFKAAIEDGTAAMLDLGGRGPGYYNTDGRYYGPPEEFRN